MIDAAIVARKLSTLTDHVARARRRRPDTSDTFCADVDLQDALAMSVLVAIQEAIDIAFHIDADEKFGVPASNAEAFTLLADQGVISQELAEQLTRAAGLRNRLAHGYAAVDAARLWHELPAGLDALEEFARAVASSALRVPPT